MTALALQRAPERAPEFSFGSDDLSAIATLVYDELGIVLTPAKSKLVYGRLARRLRATGLTRFSDYLQLIDRDAAERGEALDALTTNHTNFFREAHHFEHFVETPWPELSRRLDSGGRVRIWSAACSSGEEPYTLLMSMFGTDRAGAGRLAKQDFRLLATDISANILRTAQAARYPLDGIKPVPAAIRNAWIRQVDAQAEISPALRQLVSFRSLNLLKGWPMKGRFDAIFCRNVMIYFDDPTKATLQARLADRLAPGGFLYIGHSERLAPDVARRFRMVGRTAFQKVAA